MLWLPGKIAPPNISQDNEHGLGRWTDGEIIRSVRALFPMMPHQSYATMSDEDVQSLVAHLRTMPAIRKAVPKMSVAFPVNILMRSAPKPVQGSVAPPDKSNPIAYGRYLVARAGCEICHTKMEKCEPKSGMTFAGGEVFKVPGFEVVNGNLTADVETGIGSWSEQRFTDKFKGYSNFTDENLPLAVQANFTIIPWLGFRKIPEEALKAIFAYLVESHPPVVSQL